MEFIRGGFFFLWWVCSVGVFCFFLFGLVFCWFFWGWLGVFFGGFFFFCVGWIDLRFFGEDGWSHVGVEAVDS